MAAADVEQAPARAVGADEVEQAVRGRAPALLLGQVLVVAHLAVELVQRVALREHGLLDRPALAALEQVAVLARDVRGRREMGSRKGRTVAPQSELEFPRADPAHRHAMRHATSEMPEWDAERIVDEALARQLIAGQHFTPASLRLIGEGWDNTVWLADDRWAFRFPRRAMAIPGVWRELAVLPELRLPVPVPTPVFVGEPTEEFAWPWFGAELIEGREPLGLSADARDALGRPLGEFLRALHDSTVTVELPDDPMGRADMSIRVARTVESIEALGLEAPRGSVMRWRWSARRRPSSATATSTSVTCSSATTTGWPA